MSIGLLEEHDNCAHIRNKLRELADMREEWAGYPMPLDGNPLVIEPTFSVQGLASIGRKEEEEKDPAKVRNIFWSTKYRCRVAICEDPDGKIWHAPLIGSANQATTIINTLGASDAWGIEQEHKALQTLGEMLRHRQFKQYLLTGMFMERSVKSGIMYVFRKLRPTIALRETEERVRVLCTLCMHPIGYYEHSWAGCMCPSDDVIAHLSLMRGDEKMYWRRANQHPPQDPASGL